MSNIKDTKFEIAIKEENYFENIHNLFDYWSKVDINQIIPQINNLRDQKLVNLIKNLILLKRNINIFQENFKNEKNKMAMKGSIYDILINSMPYGEQVNFRLLNVNDIEKASLDFINLFKDVYFLNYKRYSFIFNKNNKSIFNKNFRDLLQIVFESYLCYSRLRLDTVGLGSVINLSALFEENILKQTIGEYSFDSNRFYESFMGKTFFRILQDESEIMRNYPKLDSFEKDIFYEMKYSLWFDLNDKNFKNVGSDSYAILFKKPNLLKMEKIIALNRYQSQTQVDVFKYSPTVINERTGSKELSDGTYTFDPRQNQTISLFLFSRYLDLNGRSEYFDYYGTDESTANKTYNNEILKYYYNFNNKAVVSKQVKYANDIDKDKYSSKILDFSSTQNEKKMYNDTNEQLLGMNIQVVPKLVGGKRQRGGSLDKLFDSPQPMLIAKRKSSKMDMENFKRISKEYENNFGNFNENHEKMLDSIYEKLVNLPLFYDKADDRRKTNRYGSSEREQYLTFEELRKIVLFANVISNNLKLMRLFLENISKCLDFIKMNKLQMKNNVDKSSNAIGSLSSGIDRLRESIAIACNLIDILTTDSDNNLGDGKVGVYARNLFLGLDIDFLRRLNGESLTKIVNNYVFYANEKFSKDKFINLLRKISSWETFDKKQVVFGGFSLVSKDYQDLNTDANSCYLMAIKERNISNDNLLNAFDAYVNDKLTVLSGDEIKIIKDETVNLLNNIFRSNRIPNKLNFILEYYFKLLKDNLLEIGKNTYNQSVNNSLKMLYKFSNKIYNSKSILSNKVVNKYKKRIELIISDLRVRLVKNPEICMEMIFKLNLMSEYFDYFVKKSKQVTVADLDNIAINTGILNIIGRGVYEKSLYLTDPNYEFDNWWYKQYLNFQSVIPNMPMVVKKLYVFMICINKTDTGKAYNFYLVDLFGAAYGKKLRNSISYIPRLDGNNWEDDNIIIKIEPYGDEIRGRKFEIGKNFIPTMTNILKMYNYIQVPDFDRSMTRRKIAGTQMEKIFETQSLLMRDAYKLGGIFDKILENQVTTDMPFKNVFESYNDLGKKGALKPFFLMSDSDKGLYYNLIGKTDEEVRERIKYPVIVLDDDMLNKKLASEIFESKSRYLRFVYDLLLSLRSPYESKYLRDLSKVNISLDTKLSPEEYMKFNANKLFIIDIYSKMYERYMRVNSQRMKSQNPIEIGLMNGFISKETIMRKLI